MYVHEEISTQGFPTELLHHQCRAIFVHYYVVHMRVFSSKLVAHATNNVLTAGPAN